ncbi:MAG TPA: hypothetical protein VKR57_09655 [Terriglobales bacterium]|nr:hypothetical protein [Terriglobales bacterium]
MRRSRLFPVPLSARLLVGLLFAISSIPLGAQVTAKSGAGRSFGPSYDAARETTISGPIQEVVTQHQAGYPAGLHLLVAGPQGVVDIHVGPFLNKETIADFRTGASVQVIGAALSLHGKNYFLARQLTAGGRTITVRSERGFLVHQSAPRVAGSRRDVKSDEQKGSEL